MVRRNLAALVFGLVLALGTGTAVHHGTAGAFEGRRVPEITSPSWINSEPLPPEALHGRVVLVEFWTFGCYNCRNVEPKIKAWHERYSPDGLVVLGIHSPEFSYERNVESVRDYVRDHRIDYPVIIDNDFSNWNRFGNKFWPAVYLIDKRGIIRYLRVGEGGYRDTERMIESLLAESSPR